MAEESVASKIKSKQAKIDLHAQRTKERANDIATLKAAYQEAKSGIVMEDILAKAQQFMGYHQKLAQDGLGARTTGHKLEDGSQEVENYFLSKDERVSQLDKAAGIQELIDYLERQTATPPPTPIATPAE